ncbi:MAG: hypothetical protein SF053_02050 [Bacteroidia bacterium]|nr:hypothetical protein [Bacteroidia bacterium]
MMTLPTTATAQKGAKLNLVMEGEGGANGAAVVWHPTYKIYYAGFAGNVAFPLEGFDAKGRHLFTVETGFDLRGLWYNPGTDRLEGNGYNDAGWYYYKLARSGEPTRTQVFVNGMAQPDAQSVGSFDPEERLVYFLSGREVYALEVSSGTVVSSLELKVSSDTPYNWTTVQYTGIAGRELLLLDYESGKALFFDKETGRLTGKANLPADMPLYEAFNFSWANGFLWLFDKDTRIWSAFKLKIKS